MYGDREYGYFAVSQNAENAASILQSGLIPAHHDEWDVKWTIKFIYNWPEPGSEASQAVVDGTMPDWVANDRQFTFNLA